MRVEPLTRAWARWFSTMDVTFYRMFGNLSPLNWNKLVLTTRGRQTGREISTPLLFLEREGKLYVVASPAVRDGTTHPLSRRGRP
jgi:hypothetical protein